jgi:hypothetical protein
MSGTVDMIALREFPRTQGDSGGVRRVREGEVFPADPKEIEFLRSTGRAKEAPKKAVAAAQKAEAAMSPPAGGKEG